MSLFSIHNVKIDAIAACVPSDIKKVADYDFISAEERKLFSDGTGVNERRFARDEICTSDLCSKAAKRILEEQKIDPNEIDILIFVSQSPDYFLPATSIIIQDKLGLPKTTIAFDINLGCSGYIYGLSVISNFLSLASFKKGLLLCGDKSSTSLSYTDKSTYPLFGDAGSATLLSRCVNTKTMYFNLQSDGSGKDAIIIKEGGTRHPFNEQTFVKKIISDGIERCARDLELDGVEVFNFSLREVKPNVMQLLQFADISKEQIDYFVMHQANKLMNESVRKKIDIPKDKVPYSLEKYGNTSSASIPLTIVTQLKDKLAGVNKLCFAGFGVGFSWGSIVLELNSPIILELIEYDDV